MTGGEQVRAVVGGEGSGGEWRITDGGVTVVRT